MSGSAPVRRGWRTLSEALLVTAGAGYLGAQLWHTWKDRNRWPLCSYNMFNRTLPSRFPQPRVTLHDPAGSQELLPVYGLLPLEFFRVVSIMAEVFLVNQDEAIKHRFAERVLRRLNTRPWAAFDEVHASHRPLGPAGFHGLDLYAVTLDLDDYDPRVDRPLHQPELLFSYRRPDVPQA
ncbi:hypothetical protein [Micromonospora maritima]|uniref:Uncharacterized protein n=1 Tax=Micromonospora maritima TaxID=986711 RepID=A0ABW7ZF95_9ACTN